MLTTENHDTQSSHVALADGTSRDDVALTMREQLLELVHELRKPLQGIQAFAQLLRSEVEHDEHLREYVEIVLSGARDLSSVFDRLTDFVGDARIEREMVDVEREFRSVCRLTLPRQGNIRIKRACAANARDVLADRHLIRQVFYNLVTNAVDAMDGQGELSLTTRREGSVVVIALRDTGRGMSDEEVTCAAQPFWSARPGGLGLGLSVVSKIAQAHGGRLHISSAPGQGAVCEVSIEEQPA